MKSKPIQLIIAVITGLALGIVGSLLFFRQPPPALPIVELTARVPVKLQLASVSEKRLTALKHQPSNVKS